MGDNNTTKHYHPVELTNAQRLEASELMTALKDADLIDGRKNLGQFVTDCFFRGLNEYRKELMRHD
jgi:hypothetical protein